MPFSVSIFFPFHVDSFPIPTTSSIIYCICYVIDIIDIHIWPIENIILFSRFILTNMKKITKYTHSIRGRWFDSICFFFTCSICSSCNISWAPCICNRKFGAASFFNKRWANETIWRCRIAIFESKRFSQTLSGYRSVLCGPCCLLACAGFGFLPTIYPQKYLE